MEMKLPFQIALGPLLYYWPRQTVLNFYAEVADSAVDIVYLGETVCLRRHELRLPDWLEIAAALQQAGKTVTLSTPTLIESSAGIQQIQRLAAQPDWLLEVGEPGAIRALAGRPFVAGPHLNAYHGDTLRWLASLGARRFVAPLELGQAELAALLRECPPGLACEVMVWGRMPLAFSARCFTARHFRLNKDDCQFRCLEHPDGLALATQEGSEFLTLNGIQTQSGPCLDLLAQAGALAQLGVAVLRVSPQSHGALEAVAALDARRHGLPAPSVAPPDGVGRCNGYWFQQPGIHWQETLPCR